MDYLANFLLAFVKPQPVSYQTFKFRKGTWFLVLASKEWIHLHTHRGLRCANVSWVWNDGNHTDHRFSQSCSPTREGHARDFLKKFNCLWFGDSRVQTSLCLCSSVLYCLREFGTFSPVWLVFSVLFLDSNGRNFRVYFALLPMWQISI